MKRLLAALAVAATIVASAIVFPAQAGPPPMEVNGVRLESEFTYKKTGGDCELHNHIASLDGPPAAPGTYRARLNGGRWSWEAT